MRKTVQHKSDDTCNPDFIMVVGLVLLPYEEYLKQLLYSTQVLLPILFFFLFLHELYSILQYKGPKVRDDHNLTDTNVILLP